jgi:hypothetical protein
VKRDVFEDASSACRPSRGENRTRKATDVYGEIVRALAVQGKRLGIKQRDIENLLIVKLGATQKTTLARHLEVMVRLGYLKLTRGGTAFLNAEYDLVGSKLREVQLASKPLTEFAPRRRGRPRL